MELIDKKKFDEARDMVPILKEEAKIEEISEEKMERMLQEMQSPVKFQKDIAVKIKIVLDKQIANEMKNKGYLSENTRKWVDSYNKILKEIQSAIYGDKSVNLHLHKVSHGDISNKIRESIVEISPMSESEKKKKTRKSED